MAPTTTKKPSEREKKPKIPGGIKYVAISYGNANGKKLGYVKKKPKPEEEGKVFCKFCHRMYANTNSLRVHITNNHKEERDDEPIQFYRTWAPIGSTKDHYNPRNVPTAWNCTSQGMKKK